MVVAFLVLSACADSPRKISAISYNPQPPFTGDYAPYQSDQDQGVTVPSRPKVEEPRLRLNTSKPFQRPQAQTAPDLDQQTLLPLQSKSDLQKTVPDQAGISRLPIPKPPVANYDEVRSTASEERPTFYTAQKGDTVYSLARKFGLSVRDVIEINEMESPYLLIQGHVYLLPSLPVHQVFPGDTLTSIAVRNGISVSALMKQNTITDSNAELIPGEELILPSLPKPATKNGVAVPKSAATNVRTLPQTNAPKQKTPVKTALPKESAALSQARQALRNVPNASLPPPPTRSKQKFLLPVQGKVIQKFGERRDGIREGGIRYAVPEGTQVKAAENGVVIFSDDSLGSLGKLMLIRHQDGFYTAYAHNQALLAQRGDIVKRGATIARSGSTGDVDEPQLMFQIRKNRLALDPRRLLEKQ